MARPGQKKISPTTDARAAGRPSPKVATHAWELERRSQRVRALRERQTKLRREERGGLPVLRIAHELMVIHDRTLYRTAGDQTFFDWVQRVHGIGEVQARKYLRVAERLESSEVRGLHVGVEVQAFLADQEQPVRRALIQALREGHEDALEIAARSGAVWLSQFYPPEEVTWRTLAVAAGELMPPPEALLPAAQRPRRRRCGSRPGQALLRLRQAHRLQVLSRRRMEDALAAAAQGAPPVIAAEIGGMESQRLLGAIEDDGAAMGHLVRRLRLHQQVPGERPAQDPDEAAERRGDAAPNA